MPTPRPEPILVIDDGALPALVACLTCPDPAAVTAWFPPAPLTARAARLRAVRRHADLLGLGQVMEPAPAPADSVSGRPDPLADARLLIHAAADALRLGCRRMIWPVHFDDDLDALALAGDRARLVAHLACLEPRDTSAPAAPGPALQRTEIRFRVETPFLDLTDAQLADLAQDLDAPLSACWTCDADQDSPCNHCAPCKRWAGLFRRAAHAGA